GRVRESGVDERVDRVTGTLLGFAGKSRQKTFPAVVAGGERWPAGGLPPVGEGGGREYYF
nr:hypothetical protein [Tanacetum cinerariifolium]